MHLCRVLLDEHLRVQGRTMRHETVAEMQTVLDTFLLCYSREWPHPAAGLQRQIGRRARTPAGDQALPIVARTQPFREERPLSDLLCHRTTSPFFLILLIQVSASLDDNSQCRLVARQLNQD